MKVYFGKAGYDMNGQPDPTEIHKETNMAKKSKKAKVEDARSVAERKAAIAAGPEKDKRTTVLLRFARTLGATVVGVLAVWAAGPDALELVTDPTQQAILLAVVVPMLTAAEKALRYGGEQGEDPEDKLI